jgi:hypothetical protein
MDQIGDFNGAAESRVQSQYLSLPSTFSPYDLADIAEETYGKYPSKPPSSLKVVSYTCKKYRCQGNDRAA